MNILFIIHNSSGKYNCFFVADVSAEHFFFFILRNAFLLLFYPGFPQELPLKAD